MKNIKIYPRRQDVEKKKETDRQADWQSVRETDGGREGRMTEKEFNKKVGLCEL